MNIEYFDTELYNYYLAFQETIDLIILNFRVNLEKWS